MDEQDIERLYQDAATNAATKLARQIIRAGVKLTRFALKKIIPALLSWLGPVLVPVLAGALIFGFFYFAVFMLPKYIMTGGTAPFEGQAVGVMRVCATGYTSDFESTGKKPGDPGFGITSTGVKAVRGVVAVDPRVIPYGTRMYIPGYGYGIALDCGGAIKGEKIDLYFDSAEEARQWGKQWVTIQLMGKGDIPQDVQLAKANVAILSFGNSDTEWPLEKDAALYKTYLSLDAGWLDGFISKGELDESPVDSASGNASSPDATVGEVWGSYSIPSEIDQVDPHRVPWCLLAAFDKVVGDPACHGDHGLESEGHGRKPNPGRHFKELCPKLKWQTFNLYYYHQWTVHTKEGDKTYTEEYTKKIKLLASAESYDANYSYAWDSDTIEKKSEDSYTKIVIPKAVGVTRTGPYFQKVKEILKSYGLDSEMDLEMTLRIAQNLDDTFSIDSWLFGTPLELDLNTESGAEYGGEKFRIRPVSGPVTSPFGMRMHPILKQVRMHTGIDISAPYGTPVVAAKDGTVIFTGVMAAYGNVVMIEHGDCRTMYAHLSRFAVQAGEKVREGQRIGYIGSTGWSTGPHLHFEVRVGSNRTEYVDPARVLP